MGVAVGMAVAVAVGEAVGIGVGMVVGMDVGVGIAVGEGMSVAIAGEMTCRSARKSCRVPRGASSRSHLCSSFLHSAAVPSGKSCGSGARSKRGRGRQWIGEERCAYEWWE